MYMQWSNVAKAKEKLAKIPNILRISVCKRCVNTLSIKFDSIKMLIKCPLNNFKGGGGGGGARVFIEMTSD